MLKGIAAERDDKEPLQNLFIAFFEAEVECTWKLVTFSYIELVKYYRIPNQLYWFYVSLKINF